MAKLINDSQAWESVKNFLGSRDIIANYPSDISKILEKKYTEEKNSKSIATTKVDELLQNLETEFVNDKKGCQAELEAFELHTKLEVEQIQIAINLLRQEKGFIRNIINRPRIQKLKGKIQKLRKNKDKFFNNLKEIVSKKEYALRNSKNRRELLIEDQRQSIKDDIFILKQTLQSHELAGAIAELNLIGLLAKLPENYIVVNNVNLIAEQPIKFDGEWLRSAQIDHLVISPAGIFIIEAKNWSKEFSESGDFYDPYKQVKRANYLCHKQLKSKINNIAVRSIIAHTGNIPKKTDDSYTKVLLFKEVNGYINWFKERKLSNQEINSIANYLS